MVSFFTAVDYGDSSKTKFQFCLEKADDYFYLRGRKARVIASESKGTSHGIEWVSGSPSLVTTCLKVASYFTIVLPILALIAKAIFRYGQKFHEIEKKPQNVNGSPNNFTSAVRPVLDLDDFISKCAPQQQAMIYGTTECEYMGISSWLSEEQEQGRFRDVFNCFLGDQKVEQCSMQEKTSYNRVIRRIRHAGGSLSKCECKAALVNLVVENIKRKRDGIPIIPIVFVVDKNNVKLDVHSIVNRGSRFGKNITSAEIRRAYKLCYDPDVSEEVRNVAKNTFVFISLQSNQESDPAQFSFIIRPTPWETTDWKDHWTSRKKIAQSSNKPFPWREEMQKLLSQSH